MCEDRTLFLVCEKCQNKFEMLESVYYNLLEDKKEGIEVFCPECRIKLEKKV